MTHLRNSSLASVCLLVAVCAATVAAATPEITSTTPRGMQRGTTRKIILHGARVQDGRQIIFRSPRHQRQITETDRCQASGNWNWRFPPIRLRDFTRCGWLPRPVYPMSSCSAVGTLPTVEEQEPNSEFTTPQEIESNVTVEGTIPREDVDYYAVNLKAR